MTQGGARRESERRGLVRTLLLLAVLLLLVLMGSRPPLAAGADAPASRFSAARALEILGRLLGDGRPHPVASAPNRAFRERLVAEVRALGLEPRVEEELSCSPAGRCARVANVVVEMPGASPEGLVMLACHYDSVGAGPGASDDGAAVASILEIARALSTSPRPERGVVLFFGDGEEAGLLGARAFLAHDPLARRVEVVVNLEARGTDGPSALFETSRGNLGLVRLAGSHVPRPVTSSVLFHLYELLPNDTDLTVFKQAGIHGLNFAFAGGLDRYHTSLDDLAHLDPRSVQHQGDGALAVTTALASRPAGLPLDARPAVFQDVLGLFVLSFPATFAMPLAVLAAATILGGSAAIGRTRPQPLDETMIGLAVFVLLVVSPPIAGQIALWVVEIAAGLPRPWAARPLPYGLLVAGAAASAGFAVLRLAAATGALAATIGGSAVLAGAALVAAWLLPGASLLALAPALGAAAAILGALLPPGAPQRLLQTSWPLLTALVYWPLARALWTMVGLELSLSLTLPLAIVIGTLVPLAAGVPRALPRILAMATGVAALWAFLSPARDAATPDPLVIVARQIDGASDVLARTRIGARLLAPPAIGNLALAAQRQGLVPWSQGTEPGLLGAPLPPLGLEEPTVEVLRDATVPEGRRLELRLRSPRDGADLLLGVRDGEKGDAELEASRGGRQLLAIEVEQHALPEGWREETRRGEWCVVRILGAGSADVALLLSGSAPLEVALVDQTRGLPPGLPPIQRPRDSAPFQDGDVTVVGRSMRL